MSPNFSSTAYIYLYICIVYTLFCSFLCLADHCMFFYFQPFPPPTSRAKTRRSSSQESLRGTGAKRVGWGCHHWPTWQHQLNPCLAHLQWYELSPGASKTCGKIKNHWVFFHVFCWMNLIYQLSSSWNSPTFWGQFLLAKNTWILWGGVRGHSEWVRYTETWNTLVKRKDEDIWRSP